MVFSDKILDWYNENKRVLPWRGSRDPYKIWLSEIILQQTRVAQGTPYYLKFVDAFPEVTNLAEAEEETVLKLWQGLGYYSRARNLHAAAKMVVNEYGGTFPNTYKELIKLKGVGDYTASAIASICYDERQAVVDGNVYRVLSRYFGIATPINSSEGIKYFKKLAQELLHKSNVRDYNQGIMEFGAIQCTPKNPGCISCPLQDGCMALKEKQIDILPVKLKKAKVRIRYFNYIVPIYTDEKGVSFTLIKQRKGKGIWQNLWEFPLYESEKSINLKAIEGVYKEMITSSEEVNISIYNKDAVVHKLSHQHLHTKFWIVEVAEALEGFIPVTELDKYPVSVLTSNFINTFKF